MDEDIRALERELQRSGKRVIVVDTDDFEQFFHENYFLPDIQAMFIVRPEAMVVGLRGYHPRNEPYITFLLQGSNTPQNFNLEGEKAALQLIQKWKAAKMASIRRSL